jgi:hypothetical protein
MIYQLREMRELFKNRPNEWIPLPELMKIGAQYNARIHELRGEGLHIENKIQVIDDVKHSWYRYCPERSFVEESTGQFSFT